MYMRENRLTTRVEKAGMPLAQFPRDRFWLLEGWQRIVVKSEVAFSKLKLRKDLAAPLYSPREVDVHA